MKQLLILITMAMMTTGIYAQKKMSLEQVKEQLTFFQKQVSIPTNYHFDRVSEVKVDQKDAYWFRYEKGDNQGLEREHYSFVVTKDAPYRILGFTYMDSKYVGTKNISKEACAEIASSFLKQIDPTLEKGLEGQWIAQHDEEIIVDGKKQTVSGMKYKCYSASTKDYTWVIVGYDGSIITFERDILWSDGMAKRLTNKWLHDNWLVQNKFN